MALTQPENDYDEYRLAEWAGVTVRILRGWIADGLFPDADVNGKGRKHWRGRDLQAWLDAGCPTRSEMRADRTAT